MEYQSASHKLQVIDQQHILEYWNTLTPKEQDVLLHQVSILDVEQFRLQRKLLVEKRGVHASGWEPLQDFVHAGNAAERDSGLEYLRQGRVGCLVVAGGQGTRLGYDGPKGEVGVSVIRQKSLFQLLAEKTLAAGKQVGRALSLAIMTSPLNHKETVAFFRKHDYFGLQSTQVDFFQQEMLPLLDQKGDLFLEERGKITEGPDGNGTSFKHFVRSGIWDKWRARGVELLLFTLVDNALADPFDAELIGTHRSMENEVTIKGVLREDPTESVGVLVRSGGKVRVVEYSEIPDSERLAVDVQKQLKHRCANISLFALTMDFVQKVGIEDEERMPYHLALKAVHYLNAAGESVKSTRPIAWKFEKFIFDFLALAKRVGVIVYPREQCYAPLKNAEGSHSLQTVREALLASDRRVIQVITGKEPPDAPFELAQDFYYPTLDLLSRWRGRTVPSNEYVEVI